MLEPDEINQIARAVVDLLIENKFVGKSYKPRGTKRTTDIKQLNEASLKHWVESGVFNGAEYDFSEDGPYDWRYIINKGSGLSASKAMLAFYWREKSKFKKFGKPYSFPSKGAASNMMMTEMRYAEQLSSAIKFSELKPLIEKVDDKFSAMFKDKVFEWKLKNLSDNIDLVLP